MSRNGNIVYVKAKRFGIRIVRFKRWLCEENREYVLADQILRSGTSIGANISEAINASSRKDFINKLTIAIKECSETLYWLDLMLESGVINTAFHKSLHEDCSELYRILSSIIISTRQNNS